MCIYSGINAEEIIDNKVKQNKKKQCIWNQTTDPNFKLEAHSNTANQEKNESQKANWRSNFRLYEVITWIS